MLNVEKKNQKKRESNNGKLKEKMAKSEKGSKKREKLLIIGEK